MIAPGERRARRCRPPAPGGGARPARHEHRQAERPCGGDLGVGRLAAARLGHDDVDRVLAQQGDLVLDAETAPAPRARPLCRGRPRRRLDRAHQEPLIRAGEGAEIALARRSRKARRPSAGRQRAGLRRGPRPWMPAVARLALPGRAQQPQARHAGGCAACAALRPCCTANGMGRVDHPTIARSRAGTRQPGGTAEAADAEPPGGARGARVRPASERDDPQARNRRRRPRASSAASAVPPRISTGRQRARPSGLPAGAADQRPARSKTRTSSALRPPADRGRPGAPAPRRRRRAAGPPPRQLQHLVRGAGAARVRRAARRRRRARRATPRAPARRPPSALRMQVEMAGGELGELAEAAGEGHPRDRVAAQILERAADEVAHVDQRQLGQTVERLDRALRGRAGRGGDVGQAGGARDVDAAMDRMDPRRAGDTGRRRRSCPGSTGRRRCRAGRWRPPREHLAARDRRSVTSRSPASPQSRAISATTAAISARGAGIDRRLADRRAAGPAG